MCPGNEVGGLKPNLLRIHFFLHEAVDWIKSSVKQYKHILRSALAHGLSQRTPTWFLKP